MLACARIGAVHAVVPAHASAAALAARIEELAPKLILSASADMRGGQAAPCKPRLDAALALCRQEPPACIVLQRPAAPAELLSGRDHDWKTLWNEAVNYAKTSDCVPLPANHPLCIAADGALRDHGGTMVASGLSMRVLSGARPGQVVWPIPGLATVSGLGLLCGSLLHGHAAQLSEDGTAVEAAAVALPWSMPAGLGDPPFAAASP
jgi:propionyl-CoA synthetase